MLHSMQDISVRKQTLEVKFSNALFDLFQFGRFIIHFIFNPDRLELQLSHHFNFEEQRVVDEWDEFGDVILVGGLLLLGVVDVAYILDLLVVRSELRQVNRFHIDLDLEGSAAHVDEGYASDDFSQELLHLLAPR